MCVFKDLANGLTTLHFASANHVLLQFAKTCDTPQQIESIPKKESPVETALHLQHGCVEVHALLI